MWVCAYFLRHSILHKRWKEKFTYILPVYIFCGIVKTFLMKLSTDLIWIWIHNREVFRECQVLILYFWGVTSSSLVLKAVFVESPRVLRKSICFCQHKPMFKFWSSFTRFYPKNIQSLPFIFVACIGATLSLDKGTFWQRNKESPPENFLLELAL